LENSYKSSERLLKLIEELLTVSRIQRGTFQITKRLFLPSDAVHNVQEMVSSLAQAEAVTLDIAADWAGQQMLDGDQDRLEQVMTNLISNAIKFTPEGGQVTVQSHHEAGQWHFTVQDTGIGIPEADLPRLFDRFYRASNARESEIQGTGLGLYVCKAIVEQHGGQIGLDSREGAGTTAWFTVPVSSEPVQEQG
jgi:signal transduction histidine kinase